MTCLSMEDFVGNGALKEVLPKLLQEGWDNVPTLKLMKTEDMDAINMTQQQKDSLGIRSYLHDRALLQYGDKLEVFGKCLPEFLGLSTNDLSAQFGMKRGHIARFIDTKTSAAAYATDPLLQAPHTLTSSSKTTTPSRYNNSSINKGIRDEWIMDPKLYRAAMESEENEDIDDVLRQYNDKLEQQFTSNKNTVLHVAAQFGNQKCVKKILEKSSSLLRCLNINGETPLHIAARQGHYDIVETLILCAEELDQEELESGGGGAAAKEMLLRATNKDKDTALHMAVRKRYNSRVVKLLTQKEKEFTHLANNSEETPLFLAAERGYTSMVSAILENCASPPAYGGPGDKTALHAAVMNRLSWNTENIEKLLEWKPDLIKETDAYGWTPLHYAARYGNPDAVEFLLKIDKSVMYITTDDEDEKTALHIAAANGHVKVMEELLSYCPDCWEMINSKGQNVLHIAVDMQQESTIEYMLEKPWLIHLINQKDIEGNTPLHLLEASKYEMPKLSRQSNGDWDATNNNNMTPEDVRQSRLGLMPTGYKRMIVSIDQDYITKWKGDREERKKVSAAEENRKRAGTHLIVATLIATVTFAAGFTIPGGYDGNQGSEQGMPVLIKEAAFKAFVTTNTIAVICSVSSAFLTVSASFYNDENKQDRRYKLAFSLILIAMGAMMVALITGTYVVLSHSLAIAIIACVIGCLSFLILIPEVIKLYGILKEFWSTLDHICEYCCLCSTLLPWLLWDIIFGSW